MSAAEAPLESRQTFIKNTYLHLGGAILAFGMIEALLLRIPGVSEAAMSLVARGGFAWLVVLGLFMGVAWVANSWAHSGASRSTQYFGLGLYTVAEAVIFLPIIVLVQQATGDNEIIYKAFGATCGIFGALTLVAFTTKKDFSFLGGALKVLGIAAVALIVLSLLFGLSLGTWFAVGMIVFISLVVLYQTSQIMFQYRTDQHVGAALGLFASFATMLWYVLQIFMSRE